MNIVCGRAGSGKTHYIMNDIKNTILEAYNGPLICIVPDQFSFETEKKLIREIEKNGIIDVQVLSFKRLAYKIFNEFGVSKNRIEKAGRSMMIFDIIMKNNDKLTLLKDAQKNPGIVQIVTDMISEFKKFNVTPEILKDIEVDNEYLKIKIHDLYIIYNEFESRVIDDYIDVDDELTVLASIIDESLLVKNAKIWIDEFDGFTSQEYNIISKLINKADVTLTLTLNENNRELFSSNFKTFEKLKKLTDVNIINLSENKKEQSNEIKHIERNIFSYPLKQYENEPKDVDMTVCKNPYSEIEEVARQITKKIMSGKYRYNDFVILGHCIEQYKDSIDMIFGKYNIPYFIDSKSELQMQPLMHLILSLLDICSNNFSYESMFNYLKVGYIKDLDMEDIDLVENYVLRWGIRGNTWQKEWIYKENDNENEIRQLEKINIIKNKIIEPIIEFKNNLKSRKTVREVTTELYNFLIKIGVYDVIKSKINLIKNEEVALANEYAQVWNIFIKIMDEMVQVLGEQYISFEHFKNILKIGIMQNEIGIIPPASDQITIGDISRTKNNEARVLYVIGANDGIIPQVYAEEGFINDNDRNILINKGIELAKSTKDLLDEENLNLYKSFSMPSDEIHIFYSSSDMNGKNLRPSIIIQQIKRMFPEIVENSTILGDLACEDYITTSNATFEKLLLKLRECASETDIDEKWYEVFEWYKNNSSVKANMIDNALHYKNTMEYADKNRIKSLYGTEINTSVSKLEKFSNCPFSFFLKYGLKAKERKIYKLENPDEGLFLHEVLEKFTDEVMAKNIKWNDITRNWCDDKVASITKSVIENFKFNIFESSNRLIILSKKLERILKNVIWIIVSHMQSGSFEIEGSEVEFGKGKEYGAIEIELDGENKFILNGKIDRVDIAKTSEGKFIRIIDYKSYDKQLKLSDVYYGLQLQLITYLDAISEDDLMPGGVLYFKIQNPIFKQKKNISTEEVEKELKEALRMKGILLSNVSLINAMDKNIENSKSDIISLSQNKQGEYTGMPLLSEEQFKRLRVRVRDVLKQIGNELIKGNVKNEPLKNGTKTSCEYCEYKTICQFDRCLGNKYRIARDLKNDEVINLLQGGKENG